MSAQPGVDERTVVVRVQETISPTLAGHDGIEYQSPPLPPEEAMMLVGLLLGRGAAPKDDEVRWRCPIAGGQRTITIEPLSELVTPSGSAARR